MRPDALIDAASVLIIIVETVLVVVSVDVDKHLNVVAVETVVDGTLVTSGEDLRGDHFTVQSQTRCNYRETAAIIVHKRCFERRENVFHFQFGQVSYARSERGENHRCRVHLLLCVCGARGFPFTSSSRRRWAVIRQAVSLHHGVKVCLCGIPEAASGVAFTCRVLR